MRDTPASRGIVVYRPTTPGENYAVHVARAMPIDVANGPMTPLLLPLPEHEDPATELAFRSLYLPHPMSPNMEVAPPGVESGLQRPWQHHLATGLLLPTCVAQLRTLENNTRTKTLLVPSEVDLRFGPDVLSRLAWMVLGRVPASAVAFFAADAAVRSEVLGAGLSPVAVAAMRFGQPRAQRLGRLAADGEMFLNHDTLRWVVREVAAAVASGTWTGAGLAELGSSMDEQAAASVLFPSLLTGAAPGYHEVVRALWALHESYTFSTNAFGTYDDNHEAALSMMTAIVMGQPQWGAWAPRLEYWIRMLQLPDGDPALAGIRLRPSVFRAAFQSAVGLETEEWFALMWFLGMRAMMLVQQGAPLHREIRWLLSESLVTPLETRFDLALRARAVTDLQKLGQVILDELPSGSYGGLGSLPTVEGMAMRNAPFLEIDTDVVVPMGVHLLSERAVALPKLVVGPSAGAGGAREVNGLIGKCFEAMVRDAADSARPRHRVLTGQDIDAVVPSGDPRCDAIVVYVDEWLLVESGLQTLPRGFGQGDVQTILDKCSTYHAKGDQADATQRHLGVLAQRYGLVPPRYVTNLVVTETTVFTVPLMDELRRQNRRRNPLFVTSFAEFTWLMAAGSKWSIPGLVRAWQDKEQPVPLLVHLHRTSQLAPVQGPKFDLGPEAWIAHLGTKLVA